MITLHILRVVITVHCQLTTIHCPHLLTIGISRFCHRPDNSKHGAATLATVANGKTSVMQLCKATGVIEANACAVVDDGPRLIVELVVTLEDVLTLLLRDALTRIGNRHLYIIVCDVE